MKAIANTHLTDLLHRMQQRGNHEALVFQRVSHTCDQLLQAMEQWDRYFDTHSIGAGRVVGVQSGYSPDAIALLLALFRRGAIVALVPPVATDVKPYIADGHITHFMAMDSEGLRHSESRSEASDHPLLASLRDAGAAGFIIYTSGTTGKPKAVLHATERFLSKFVGATKQLRTLAFLLMDHIAGLDTLFYTLFSGGALIIPGQRDPGSICQLIQDHRVEVLPTSPAFLNLLLISEAWRRYDLSCLQIITYGSEPMPQSTLERVAGLFPDARIIQKYGTSEFGAPHSKSRGNTDLWMKMDSRQFRVKVIDNIMWIKADSAMLGYLNATAPMDEEGWICTGDEVEVDGEWLRILGRQSDMINVGGEKVYPGEVEDVIARMDEVMEVVVTGESHPMLGQCVKARIRPARDITAPDLRKAVRKHCRNYLPNYKIPIRIDVTEHPLTSARQKKIRD